MVGVERKLTTIVVADVVGFSKLMGEDETATLQALLACRSIIDPIIVEHHGRVFGSAGDSVLAEFPSPVEAVICAREFQERIAERNHKVDSFPKIQFRVGINLGDVMIEGDNLYGDGVNVADRLQGVAEPEGICVSSKVYEEVKRKLNVGFTDGGKRTLKNIEDPVAIYHVGSGQTARTAQKSETGKKAFAAASPPSIAVGELRAIGGNEEAVDLAEGLIDDIREGLGHYSAISVISGGPESADTDFVLEGSVRASGKRLRLTFALLEGANRHQIWSEKYDRTLDDVFELQDEISRTVASTIRVRVKAQIFERLADLDNAELDTPDLLDKAAGYFVRGYGGNDQAEAALRQAVDRSPENSMAKAMLAFCLYRQCEFSAAPLPKEMREEIAALAHDAVALSSESYFARLISALVHFDFDGDFEAALEDARTALESNPGFTQAQAMEGIARLHLGEVDQGLQLLNQATEANKADPHRYRHHREQAVGEYVAGRLDKAIRIARHLVEQAPDLERNRLLLGVLLQISGAKDKALDQIATLGNLEQVRHTQIGDKQAAEQFQRAQSELIAPA